MILVIAVDDELPALRRVGKLLESMEDVRTGGLFDKSHAFLEHALTTPERIDLVLLDMEMPLHGLEVARRLRAVRPEIHIAFLTAHEEFARDAFDVEALDYLLKPIDKGALERTIRRSMQRSLRLEKNETIQERGASVRSFGPFEVTAETGERIRFRNSKGKELLAYLYFHRGKHVSKAQIIEEIWPGRDTERSLANLYSTMYQLRKDLEICGLPGIIEQSKTTGGSYCLRWSAASDDVAAFENELQLYKQTSSLTHVLRAVQLYGDGYLAGSGYEWAAPRQAELEMHFIGMLEVMADTYVRQQRYEIALNPMRKWAQLVPLSGRLHAKMIALLLLMDREEDAREYRELALELLESDDDTELDYSRLSANPAAFFREP
jgi:Response regulator containing CheY-like receiver and SARP domains